MSVINLSMSAAGTSAVLTQPTAIAALPMARQNWNGKGASVILNFSGQGSAGGTPAVAVASVQVSNDLNANPNLSPAQQATARWCDLPCFTDVESDVIDNIDLPVAFVRLYLTAYTSGTVTCQIGIPDDSSPANP